MEKYSYFYVGTYTHPILFGTGEIFKGKGEGIYLLKMNNENGAIESCDLKIKTENPSYLCLNKEGSMLYAVNELKEYQGKQEGAVTAFYVNKENGDLTKINTLGTNGQDPCHLALSLDEKNLAVANFMTGSTSVYRVSDKGLEENTSFVQHEGRSVDPMRQKGPHAHACIFIKDIPYLFVPDLGTDCLVAYSLLDGVIEEAPTVTYKSEQGSGPRYGEYLEEQNKLYLINELASSISVLEWTKEEKWKCLQTIPTIATPCDNICADLHISPNSKFLYASNRGADSIVVYTIDAETGKLTKVQEVSCGGKTPRNFAIERTGKYLIVGNQDSDQIIIFGINRDNGELTKIHTVDAKTPVCIVQTPFII